MMGFQPNQIMKSLNTYVAYIALTFAAAAYGAWHILANIAMGRGAPALIFALYRCAGGMGCCLLALKLCPELGLKTWKETGKSVFGDVIIEPNGYSRKDDFMFMTLGLCMAGNICGFIIANTMLPALTCSIFSPLVPVVTAFICIAWGIEDKHPWKLAGLSLAVLGAGIVVFFEDHHAATAPVSQLDTMTTLMASGK